MCITQKLCIYLDFGGIKKHIVTLFCHTHTPFWTLFSVCTISLLLSSWLLIDLSFPRRLPNYQQYLSSLSLCAVCPASFMLCRCLLCSCFLVLHLLHYILWHLLHTTYFIQPNLTRQRLTNLLYNDENNLYKRYTFRMPSPQFTWN